ncbi:uncharacterized protein LOC131322745 isoform X2 [Rhododendron vialii]|uniref:uncharacterized protein LOC131322745 isoform X2 n=1 Tax=Rhododendron vialii TaxID=182163 RepID=UPI00265D92BB|nr:uncharacterized protein LOC131322745 isoform X2 [Rhododendron vialii]
MLCNFISSKYACKHIHPWYLKINRVVLERHGIETLSRCDRIRFTSMELQIWRERPKLARDFCGKRIHICYIYLTNGVRVALATPIEWKAWLGWSWFVFVFGSICVYLCCAGVFTSAGPSQDIFSCSCGGSGDNLRAAIFLWDWRTKKQIACLEESHTVDVTQVHFVPDHQNKLLLMLMI